MPYNYYILNVTLKNQSLGNVANASLTPEQRDFDTSILPETERNILVLVCTRLICAVHEKHIYETVTAVLNCGEHSFIAKGKTVAVDGWKAVDTLFKNTLKLKSDDDDKSETTLPPIRERQVLENVAANITEHFTQVQKPYTEDTLLSAMEHAEAEEMSIDAERKGLGTPATRGSIIEKLVSSGFMKRQGKQLTPTHRWRKSDCYFTGYSNFPKINGRMGKYANANCQG